MGYLEGIPKYNFSRNNRYASDYYSAYSREVAAQDELAFARNKKTVTATEIEKLKADLKRWEDKTKQYANQALSEENKLNKNGSEEKRLDYWA